MRRFQICAADDFIVTRKFTVLLEPAEEGGFITKCLELPVATQGETEKEALKNLKETMEGYLEVKTKLLGRKVKGEKADSCRSSLCSRGVKLLGRKL